MTLAPGARLGPYEILAPLGAGGMGEVYRARDPRLGREVAIKVLPAEVATDPERLRRFEQEARAASALNQSNILTVHDLGQDAGVAYLVTELLSGESLRDLAAHGPLAPARAVELARQLAKGLAAAHERGIVHRDLKPENLFLTQDGTAKILDFGLARQESADLAGAGFADASTRLETSAGTVLGTVGYMAPEQVRGEKADARSDLFSLGVVIHELLTGANPFRKPTAVESLHAILKEEPPAIAPTPSGASSALGRIVARLLEKRPENRFQSARDLGFALDELAAGPSSVAAPGAGPGSRKALVAGITTGLVLALVAGSIWLARSKGGAETAAPVRSLAVLPFASLSHDTSDDYFSDGMTDALTTELAHLSALKVIARNSAARFKGSIQSPAEIAKALGVEALVSGSVLRAADRVRISAQLADAKTDRVLWAESYERAAKDVLSLQGEVAAAIAGAIALEISPAERTRLETRRAVDPRALDEYLKGRSLWARRTEDSTREALAHFKAAIAIDPGFALGYTGIADAHIIFAAYNWMEPREAAPIALAAVERAIELDPTAGEPHASRGDLAYHYDLDFALSKREHDRAIELSPGYAVAYHWRSEVQLATGQLEAGLADLHRAVDLDPLAVAPLVELSSALALAGQHEEANRVARRAIELSPSYVRSRTVLTRLLLGEGHVAEALGEARHAIELDSGAPTLGDLALCLVAARQQAEARSIRDRLAGMVAENPRVLFDLARVDAALGERAEAVDSLRRALDRRDFRVPAIVGDGPFAPDFLALRGVPEYDALAAGIGKPR